MKKKYTKRQILEAIRVWEDRLRKLDESGMPGFSDWRVAFVYERLAQDAVGKLAFDRPVRVRMRNANQAAVLGSPTRTIIVPGKKYDIQKREYVGEPHVMTDEDAEKLAQLYNNWYYAGYDKEMQAELERLIPTPTQFNQMTARLDESKKERDDEGRV